MRILHMEDIIKCTFFTYDAIAFDISNRELFAHEHYVSDLLTRRLEINLLPNPSVDGNLVRAVRRILSQNLVAGPILRAFLEQNINAASYQHIAMMEHKLYGYSFAEKYGTERHLLEALMFPGARETYFDANQLHFNFG